MSTIDQKFPLATVTFVVSVALIFLGYLNDDLTIKAAFETLGFAGVGSGAVGISRSMVGKGK
jgi:hypothetical protein